MVQIPLSLRMPINKDIAYVVNKRIICTYSSNLLECIHIKYDTRYTFSFWNSTHVYHLTIVWLDMSTESQEEPQMGFDFASILMLSTEEKLNIRNFSFASPSKFGNKIIR